VFGLSTLGSGQLELDIVRVAEGQHEDAEVPQILDFPMGDGAAVELRHGAFEVLLAAHSQADVIQPNPVFVEAVPGDRPAGVGGFVESQNDLVVGEQVLGAEFGDELEVQHLGVKVASTVFVRDGQGEVVNYAGRNSGRAVFSLVDSKL
jgi:hypothetical protein